MSELARFDLEQSSARAWSRFQARLADHLVEMADEDILLIKVEAAGDLDGSAPFVQFIGFGQGSMLRGEVVGNAWLDERYRLDDAQHERLISSGWQAPTVGPGEVEGEGSANYFIDAEVSRGDRLAVMAVTALREVFGVAHPAFLVAENLADDPEESRLAPGPSAGSRSAEEPLATMADSSEHLQEMVDAALTQMLGSAPEKDDDGDIPLPCAGSMVFVRVDRTAPAVHLFGVVVDDVSDLGRAAFEVNVLNRDTRFLNFILVGDQVVAQAHLPAWPFVPEHLRTMLAGMTSRIDEIGGDLVARVGGRRPFGPDEPEDRAPAPAQAPPESAETTLMTLLHLDSDPDSRLDPELAAGVCRHDQGLIVQLLVRTEGQESVWERHREQAVLRNEPDEAEACEQELVGWQRTTALLRRALRLVVERSLDRQPSGGALYATPTRIPRRRKPPRFRGSMAPRSPRSHRIHNAEELLALYDVEDLVALDETLTECSGADVEVFDLDDRIEIQVEGASGRLPYPFTSADFHALLEHVHERAFQEQE